MSGKSLKVVILGDSGVGKTSLIQRYISGRPDIQNSTLGAVFVKLEHHYKNDNGVNRHLPIQFWDTAGQERYNALIPMYTRDADFIILAFDLTNYISFTNLKHWLKFALEWVTKKNIIVVGCKNDLTRLNNISKKEINSFLKDNKFNFFSCSSMTGNNISELFLHIKLELEKIYENLFEEEDEEKNLVHLDNYDNLFETGDYFEFKRVKKKCCLIN